MSDETNALIVDYDYDAAGRLSQKTLGNGVYTTYDYDDAGHVLSLVNLKADGAVLSRFDYTYDVSGRRTSMTTLDGTFAYGYDALGQLTSVTYPDGRVVVYDYDEAGNRRQVIDDGVATPYTTNDLNQYTQVGDVTYAFDLDGNLVSKTEAGVTTTYTYNVENRLVRVETPTDVWEYSYDAFGNRVGVTDNGADDHLRHRPDRPGQRRRPSTTGRVDSLRATSTATGYCRGPMPPATTPSTPSRPSATPAS